MALFCFGDILAWGNLEWDCFGMGLFHIESADKDCYKCEFPHILAIALGPYLCQTSLECILKFSDLVMTGRTMFEV